VKTLQQLSSSAEAAKKTPTPERAKRKSEAFEVAAKSQGSAYEKTEKG
jgi:hypothetical protein